MNLKSTTARFASLLVFFTVMTGQAQSFLTNGLVAYYPFNGNANDASGNGNNGTVNGATFTTDRFGYTNNALVFDSNNVSTSFFPPLGTSSRSISIWFNVTNNLQMTFLGYGGDGVYWGDRFELNMSETGNLGLDFSGAGVTTTSSYNDGNWHQFVVVAPTNAALTDASLYVDGMPQTNLSYYNNAAMNTAGTSPLVIGKLFFTDFTGSTYPVVGSLDDIRIYNRALSSSEVAGLYQFESAQIVNLNKAVWLSFSNLRNGTNYQVQVSTALTGSFSNSGTPFAATNSTMNYPAYWNVGDWSQLLFRLQALP
jgi:hypothetical protein